MTTIEIMSYYQKEAENMMKEIDDTPFLENLICDDDMREFIRTDFQKGQLKNEDALLIQENASLQIDYDLINPYAYALAISPHIAGIHNPVKLAKVLEGFTCLKDRAEIILVEGAGGWYAPLNESEDISDLAKALALPVILVVGIKLGCISHAKLSWQAIQNSGLPCAGWIAVCLDPSMQKLDETIFTIKMAMNKPLLGVMPYMDKADFDLLAQQLVL